MKAREVERRLLDLGCFLLRQKGSHRQWSSADGKSLTTVPAHAGEDIKPGTLGQIERSMEPSLGKGWLRRR